MFLLAKIGIPILKISEFFRYCHCHQFNAIQSDSKKIKSYAISKTCSMSPIWGACEASPGLADSRFHTYLHLKERQMYLLLYEGG